MKTPNHKKNARQGRSAFDMEANVLLVVSRLKQNGGDSIREDLADWEPPAFVCGCSHAGRILSCRRVFRKRWQWLCPACGSEINPVRNYVPHWKNPERKEAHERIERGVKDTFEANLSSVPGQSPPETGTPGEPVGVIDPEGTSDNIVPFKTEA